MCARTRLICANRSCYVVLSSSVEGWSQHNNNIILNTHITTTTARHILVIWLGNSCSRSRSSSHASLRFPVGLPKIAFTPRVFAVGLKCAAINKNNIYNTRSLRPRSDYLRFLLWCYNFAPSSHPPHLIVPVCHCERTLFPSFLHRILHGFSGLDIRYPWSADEDTCDCLMDARNTSDATQ